VYTHSQNYTAVTFRTVQRNWNFAPVRIHYRCGELYMYALGSTAGNQIPTHWSMTDFRLTAQLLVLSLSSILLTPSSHCAFTPASKKIRCVFNKINSSFYYTLLKLRKSETAELKFSSVVWNLNCFHRR